MGPHPSKLKLIFMPFLVIGIGFISVYSFLNWLLFIKLNIFSMNQEVRNAWLPFILTCLVIYLWIAPRVKLLKLKSLKPDYISLYLLAAGAVIIVPTIIAQEYLTTATGKLTELESIRSINMVEQTKFYTVKNYFVSKRNFGTYISAEARGRYNEKLHLTLYLSLPIYLSSIKTAEKPSAWLGMKYSQEINNRLSEGEKENKLSAFIDKSQKDFDSKDVQQFVYLDRIGNSDDWNGYQEALKKSPKFDVSNNIVLIPHNQPFEARNGNKLMWLIVSFIFGSLAWLLMLCIPKFDDDKLQTYLSNTSHSKFEIGEGVKFFIPSKYYCVTPILLSLNVGIYLLMFLSGLGFFYLKTDHLLTWGANYGPLIGEGEYWRILSSTFLHAGILHLAGNMFGLIFLGTFLEPLLGIVKFTFAYVLTGVMASLASLYWHDPGVGVGASGSIMGICGVFCSLLLLWGYLDDEFPGYKSTLLSICGVFISVNLLMGIVDNSIDNAAHIGGLLSGLLLGCLFAVSDILPKKQILSDLSGKKLGVAALR